MNTRIKSGDPVFACMVEWSARLITRYVTYLTGRTAYREARGHDAQAPIAELGEKIMHMTSKKTSKSRTKADAKLHEGMWLGLRLRNDESIIWTPSGVIQAKTIRRLLEDQRWRADEVLNIRGGPSNPVPGAGGDPKPK